MKAIKEIYKKYYKYVDTAWTQPKATANTTAIAGGNMVITASSSYSGEDAWYGFNGVYSGTSWATNLTTTGWWQIKFPYKILITGLKFYQRNSASSYRTTTARFYTSSSKTTPIGNAFSPSASDYASTTISGIPSEGVHTDTIYLNITAGVSAVGMGMLDITATRRVMVEATESDYDYYEDVDVHLLPLIDEKLYAIA